MFMVMGHGHTIVESRAEHKVLIGRRSVLNQVIRLRIYLTLVCSVDTLIHPSLTPFIFQHHYFFQQTNKQIHTHLLVSISRTDGFEK